MKRKKQLRKRINDYMYDHTRLRLGLQNSFYLMVCLLSAFIFAFGFRTFIAPSALKDLGNSGGLKLISGGVSGLSQTIIAFVDLVSDKAIESHNLYDVVYSVLYFGMNIPVFILAFKGIGKRYAFFTVLTVAMSSLFSTLLRYADKDFLAPIAKFVDNNGGLITRALLGGLCTGISSAIAYKANASAGGVDVVAHYISLRRSTLTGKYGVALNSIVVTLFTIISITSVGWGTEAAAQVFVATLFSVMYLFVSMFVIDSINIRNKKVKVEAVSEMIDLGKILIGNLPHGATIIPSKGAFTDKDKYIITMVVSSHEAKHAVEVIRQADPNAFITVEELSRVYGRFYIPPIK